MAKKLRSEDIIEKGLFKDEIENTEKFLKIVKGLKDEFKELAKASKSAVDNKASFGNSEDVKKFKTEVDNLNKSTKELTNLEKQEARLKQQLKDLNTEQAKTNQTLTRQTKEQKAALRDLEILQNKNAGTLQKLAAQNRVLRREREGLNLETEKGRKRLTEINAQIDKNNARVKANSDALKKQKLNVGNYSNSIKDAVNSSGLFSRQLMILTQVQNTLNALLRKNSAEKQANTVVTNINITSTTNQAAAKTAEATATEASTVATTANATATNAQTTATKAATTASGGFSKSLKVLKYALIGTGIGAIVVVLGSLITALASTQRGADAFSKVLRPLSVIFQRFIGFIQDTGLKIFDKLKQAFSNPKQAIIDLGEAIKNNVINRIKALGLIGEAIAKIFKGDVKEGFKELGNATIQMGTGVENAVEKITESSRSLNEEIKESLKQGELLDDLIKRFERREIDLTLPMQQQRLEFERLRAIAQDQTKTDQERIKALDDAEKVQRQLAANEMELLDLKIERMELEQSFNDTSRAEELELEKLKAERLQKETAAQKKINSLVSLRSGIEKRAEKKRVEDIEKNIQKELKALEDLGKEKEIELIKQGAKQEVIDRNTFQVKVELLMLELKLRKAIGQDVIDIELELARVQMENAEKIAKKQQESIKETEKVRKDAEEARRKYEEKQKKEADEKKKKELEKEKEKQEKRKELIQETADFIADTINRETDLKINAIETELDASKRREDQLIEAANQGNRLADESIAVERERQAKLEAERKKQLQRQKTTEIALAAITAYTSNSKNGEGNALAKTIADISTLLSFAQNVQAFEEGGLVEGGEQLVRINEKGQEFVLKHDTVKKIGVDKLNRLNQGDINALNDSKSFDARLQEVMINKAMQKVSQEFKEAVKGIAVEKWELSEITQGLKKVYQKGNSLKAKHYRKGKTLN